MTPDQVYSKALQAGKRFPELEDIILADYLTNQHYSFVYAQNVIKGRWEKAEDIILTDVLYSYLYARDIIKGRWVEAEDIIMTHPQYAYLYALYVTKGKLPDKMHNMMILHAISGGRAALEHVEDYFEFIK